MAPFPYDPSEAIRVGYVHFGRGGGTIDREGACHSVDDDVRADRGGAVAFSAASKAGSNWKRVSATVRAWPMEAAEVGAGHRLGRQAGRSVAQLGRRELRSW